MILLFPGLRAWDFRICRPQGMASSHVQASGYGILRFQASGYRVFAFPGRRAWDFRISRLQGKGFSYF